MAAGNRSQAGASVVADRHERGAGVADRPRRYSAVPATAWPAGQTQRPANQARQGFAWFYRTGVVGRLGCTDSHDDAIARDEFGRSLERRPAAYAADPIHHPPSAIWRRRICVDTIAYTCGALRKFTARPGSLPSSVDPVS